MLPSKTPRRLEDQPLHGQKAEFSCQRGSQLLLGNFPIGKLNLAALYSLLGRLKSRLVPARRLHL